MATQSIGFWTDRLPSRPRPAHSIFPLVGGLLFVIVWWSASVVLSGPLLASPVETTRVGIEILHATPRLSVLNPAGNPGIVDDLLWTTARTVLGVGSGLVAGLLAGIVMGRYEPIKLYFEPIIELLRVVPPLVYVPFFVVWFGINTLSILGLTLLSTFLIIVVNSLEAVQNVSEEYKEFARTLGADETTVYRSVVIPAMIPEVVSGIRITLGLGWGLTIVAEILGAQIGMGTVLLTWVNYSATTQILAGVLWVSALAVAADTIVTRLLRRITHWRDGS